MASSATQLTNTISKVKDYDVYFNDEALEYTSWMLPGKSEASSYSLITNLRTIEESAGDGTFNTLTISVPCSIESYKQWIGKYDTAGTLKIQGIGDASSLSITFNVRVNTIGDFTGNLDSISAIEIGFKVLGIQGTVE